MKILTFNWHEGYIHLLSKTGYDFDVVQKWKGGKYGWIHEFRPVPPNCNLITEEDAMSRLNAGYYDRIICHNINDLLFVYESPIHKVLIFHNKFSCEIALGGNTINKEEYLRQVHQLLDAAKNLTLVFISKAKRDDWGLDGEIILPGIDISEYGGYRGSIKRVLRVGNGLKARDIMLGFTVQDRLLNGINSTIVGLNPDIHGSRIPRDWEDFKGFMRSHRVYLNTTLHPYEDGYNLALLEAMATGMPVVSIANPTSPIEDGINGFISDDKDYLRERIIEILKDHSLAKSIGKKAREIVIEKFPIERFIKEWKRVLGDSGYKIPRFMASESSRFQSLNDDYFRQERSDMEALIPDSARKVLDIGCGEGTLGKRLLEKGIREVIGVEINPDACKNAGHNLSGVICGDIEEIDLPFSKGYFDCIICGDALEHLKDPFSVLKKIRNYLSDAGAIIASIPNVRYHGVINMLANGRWKYEDYGILDRTHLRFFTKKEMEELFYNAGFEITGITDNIDPQYYNINPLSQNISFGRVTLNGLNPDELKDLFVVQYLIRAQKARYALNAESVNFENQGLKNQKTELEEYLDSHPADLDALYKYAEMCYKLGMPDKAMDGIEKILIFEPGRKDAVELKKEITERLDADKHI